jgi:hypothetical protein
MATTPPRRHVEWIPVCPEVERESPARIAAALVTALPLRQRQVVLIAADVVGVALDFDPDRRVALEHGQYTP